MVGDSAMIKLSNMGTKSNGSLFRDLVGNRRNQIPKRILMGKKDHHALLEKNLRSRDSSVDDKVKGDYSLSYFPTVSHVPLELQPFEKRARLVSLVQRRKFK